MPNEDKRAQAKHASMAVLGICLRKYINMLSDLGLICSLVIVAPPHGDNYKIKKQNELTCLGMVFSLHSDLWKSIFDVYTSDKQVGMAWQVWIYFRLPSYKASCAQKVANLISACVWETHQFQARVTF